MYGKIFQQIYDGTLSENWQALITFQQMIVLCDADGVIDMTPSALSRRTGIPIEHIAVGLKFLEKDDPESRTPDENGRRIIRIDEHREWGWKIVNHAAYRKIASYTEKKEADRIRIEKKRNNNSGVATCRNLSHEVVNVAHTNTDTNTDTPLPPKGGTRKKIEYSESFELWWSIIPKEMQKGKADAYKKWQKIGKSKIVTPTTIIDAIKNQTEKSHFRGVDGKDYFPNAATWLNKGRWTDTVIDKRVVPTTTTYRVMTEEEILGPVPN